MNPINNPSYLHITKDDEGEIYRGVVLSPGESCVLMNLERKDVLFAPDLEEAEAIYKEKKKKEDVKVVLIERSDVNPVVLAIFLRMLIPVIAFPGAMQLTDVANIAVCPQQGVVKVGKVEAITDSNIKIQYINEIAIKGWHT